MRHVNRFGTTSDMIIREIKENGATYLLAIDVKGLYFTTQNRVDNQPADVNRYGIARDVFIDRLEKLGLSPYDLYEENKDKIVLNKGTIAKKINPIKASKRGL